MATGAPGTNGVWQYGEDDSEATFSALLNKAASTTDTQIGADRTRLTALEARKLSGLVPIVPTGVSTTGGGSASYASDGTVTITGVGAVYLQGVFTSAYRNYHVVIDVRKNTSAANYLGIQLANGTTESATGYHVGSLQAPVNSTTLTQNGTYNGTYGVLAQMYYDTGRNYASIDIYRPASAEETGITGVCKGDSAAIPVQSIIGGNHGVQTAYSALKVLVTANTMTGYVKVFGWN